MNLRKRLYRLLRRLAGGSKPGYPVSRLVMYSTLKEVCLPYISDIQRCLVISGSGRLAGILGIPGDAMHMAAYPEVDLRSLPYSNEEFDAIVSDQVLEHVAGPPLLVIREAARVVRAGGLIVHTTCFVNPRHDAPSDYWRFSPEALELLVAAAGDRVVHSGAWGNRYVLAGDAIGLRYLPVNMGRSWSITHRLAKLNHLKWPIATWVVAIRQPPAS